MGREAIEIGGRRVDQALRQVMALIHDGQFPPGARLPGERQLAESIGVSRPILREALNRLESRGLIERRSKSGNYVCTAVPSAVTTAVVGQAEEALISLADVVELRRVMEGWAVEKAAGNPDKKALAKLRTLVRTMQDTAGSSREEDFRRYQEADLAFHQVIAQMARNLLYVHLLDLFADLVKRAIAASKLMVTDDFPMQNLARHRAILQALEAGDAARAREAMSRHFALLEERLPRRGRT